MESQTKIKSLVEELRVWKEKVKKLEKAVKKDKETRKDQIERIRKTEEENKKYLEKLDLLIQKREQEKGKNGTEEENDMD